MQKIARKFTPIDFPLPSASDVKDAEFLNNMPDSEIDLTDIPDMSNCTAKHYYQFSNLVEIDEDILNLFMKSGPDYIKRINSVLRSSVSVG